MQQARAFGVCAPGGPGGKKVQPKAKAGFQDAPLRRPGPGQGQAAAVQKDLACLGQRLFTLVAVAKALAVGRAVGQPGDVLGGHAMRQ